jgi:GT2 family glycosyltransferase
MDRRIAKKRPDLDPLRAHPHVRDQSIKKENDVCVIMPTHNSAAVTCRTIAHLLNLNRMGGFDVLLVDDASNDYEIVVRQFESEQGFRINSLRMSRNVGNAGAQNAGAAAALAAGYRVIILTDNDAVLKTGGSIAKLVASLDRADVVFPANAERRGRFARLPFEATLHYLTLRASTLRRLGNVEPFFFIYVDDVEFTMRALSLGLKVHEVARVQVNHPLRKITLLTNRTAYFVIRNYCFLIACSPVAVRFKIRALLFLIVYVIMKLIHAAQFQDMNIVRTLLKAARDFHHRRLDPTPPQEKFQYELLPDVDIRGRSFRPTINRVFLAKNYYLRNAEGDVANYGLAT